MPTANSLNLELTINEIVARFPETQPVFQRFGMDTCCGGGLTVVDATRMHGIALDPVLKALHTAIEHR